MRGAVGYRMQAYAGTGIAFVCTKIHGSTTQNLVEHRLIAFVIVAFIALIISSSSSSHHRIIVASSLIVLHNLFFTTYFTTMKKQVGSKVAVCMVICALLVLQGCFYSADALVCSHLPPAAGNLMCAQWCLRALAAPRGGACRNGVCVCWR
jgi:hypothetical protein